MKKHFTNILLVIISCTIPLVLAEYIFKRTLFDQTNSQFKKYRDQRLYAAEWDENFWKLYHIFTNEKVTGRNAVIGWTYPSYYNGNFFHVNVPFIKNRRAALLYGDSFAQCVAGTVPFQDIINADTGFTKNNYFINYGTGAFGVDQIYTLFKNTYQNFNNPVVVFSFMTEDLDRSVLHIREGIKPYYTLANDSLTFNPQPYVGNFAEFIKANPVTIKSFLWRKFLYSNANFMPANVTARLTGELTNRKKVTALNQKILQAAVNELRQSKTDFIFLIFNSMGDVLMPAADNWRMQFVTNFVASNNINAVYTKDILPAMQQPDSTQLYNYYLKNDGHPNTAFIKLISNKIMSDIENQRYEKSTADKPHQNKNTYSFLYDSVCTVIKTDTAIYRQLLTNVNKENISIDTAMHKMAMWMIWEKYENIKSK